MNKGMRSHPQHAATSLKSTSKKRSRKPFAILTAYQEIPEDPTNSLPDAMPRAKGVIRIDSDSTHGWQVRVYRHGKTYSRLFSDRKHGDREKAFQAAVAYRTELEEEVAKLPDQPARRRLIRRNRNNTSGVVGISRTYKQDRRGIRHEVYAVSWNPEPGVARGTSFSIKRYGEDTAFRMACKLRWEKMKEIYGERYDVPSFMDLYRKKALVDERAEAREKKKRKAAKNS